jgi:CelD/BcsL family acetyltransferase involved in cellulose biosynthesis
VEKASWKGREQCGMDQEPAGSFYRAMLHRLCMTQSARIMFARHEDRDIGYIFGGMAQKIYRGQQFSYVQTWKDFSIGNLLQTEQIKWLCREKARRYDMGPLRGPKMEYKTHWTERQMHVQTWILVKK